MKIKTATTVTTKIKGVFKRTFTAKNGKETTIVVIQTEAGNFSNHENVLKRQKLDLDSIEEGDPVEIAYTTYFDAAHDHEYKNFVQIRTIKEGK